MLCTPYIISCLNSLFIVSLLFHLNFLTFCDLFNFVWYFFKILIILCRVVVQNERYDDWNHTLIELRRLFLDYQKCVLEYNNRPNIVVPKATNSTAAQGNFLEVLNMSLNGNFLVMNYFFWLGFWRRFKK